jgi:hypothetical protein
MIKMNPNHCPPSDVAYALKIRLSAHITTIAFGKMRTAKKPRFASVSIALAKLMGKQIEADT